MPARTFHRFTTALVAFFALTCTTAFAQKTIHVPADQPTIQAGINDANNGDTVLVAPGTYVENIDFKGKAITVTSSDGPATTIIDGGARTGVPTVAFVTKETRASVISNMTIRNGGSGGPFAYPEVSGGVYAYLSAPTILNNVITANQCNGVINNASAALIQGNTISGTIGNTTGDCLLDKGDAILEYGYTLTFGPGIVPTVLDNIIENNVQGIYGETGGVYLWSGNYTVIQGNTFRGNKGTSAGAIASANTNTVAILQNLIYGNSGGGAGAINLLPPDESAGPFIGIIAGNTIAGNSVTYTGTYSGNTPASQVYLSGNLGQYLLVNNIIVGNNAGTTAVNCDVGYSYLAYTPLVFDHNDIYAAQGVAYAGSCADQTGTYGNINADPRFVNAAAADFHLQAGSPAIDMGNNSAPLMPSTDFENLPRLTDATGLGYPVVDMGAYEFTGLRDASPTLLTLTPSSYYPFQGFPYGNTSTPFTLTAQISSTLGIPSGPVTFHEDAKDVGTVNLDATGSATLQPPVPTPGLHAFTATYPGQGIFPPAISVKFFILFPKITPSLAFTSSPNPSTLGTSVTFIVTVTSPDTTSLSPIVLTDNTTNTVLATLTPDSAGIATYSTSTLSVGNHFVTASYAGDSAHNPASASLTQTVVNPNATSITLTGSPNPSSSGQSVTFTATVTSTSGTPTGSIQFSDNGTSIGTQTLNAAAIATLSISTLSVGNHNITATYVSTGSFAGSSTSITQTVNDITDAINLTSSLNPSTYGQPVTITAHISASNGVIVAGGVRFSDGGQFLGTQTVDASGNAAITLSTLSIGAHIITGAFTPTGTSHSAAGTLTQQVNGLPTSTLLTATPLTGVAHITPITLTATVAPATPGTSTPTGQVLFYLNGAQLSLATLVNGVATYTGTLPAGVNQIYAAYVGDPSSIYSSSNSNTVSVTITAAPSALSLTSSLNPSPALTPFNLSAQLTLANGSAVGAGYPITFTIAPSTAGQGTTNASGTATTTSAGLLPGQYLVTATFAGTTDLQPATATSFIETITANPTATTLTASPNPGIQNNPVTFTSAVSALAGAASPAGTVTIYDSLSPSTTFIPIATLTIPSTAGTTTATFTTSALAPGTHILYSAFTPAAGFGPSQSAQFTLVIEPQSFTLTLSDPTLTVQTGHHRTETATLTSIGGLTGTFTLSCGTLPQYASCNWGQGSITLPANGTVSTSLTIDTDQLLGFLASNTRQTPNPGAPSMARFMRQEWAATTAFTLFPLTLLGFRRRRNLRSLLPLLILAALASTLTACGASQYPYSTTPGTYTVPITAAGSLTPGGVSPTQTVNLTLVVSR